MPELPTITPMRRGRVKAGEIERTDTTQVKDVPLDAKSSADLLDIGNFHQLEDDKVVNLKIGNVQSESIVDSVPPVKPPRNRKGRSG